jgi:hypothetical protein
VELQEAAHEEARKREADQRTQKKAAEAAKAQGDVINAARLAEFDRQMQVCVCGLLRLDCDM